MSDETRSPIRTGQRIAKAMARAGLCSRRDAEAWIIAGRVTVNGKVIESPAYNVTETDEVRVDGEPLAPVERTRLFIFHKPRGLVTTARDPEGRPTIFDALPPGLPRLVAIGRLDINTEGLLLLTNDGGLARLLELPSTGWLRRYRVRAHGTIDQGRLDALNEGVTVDGVDYAAIEARLDREQGSNVWLTIGLREGKNREIKKVLDHLGLAVNRLIRVSFGPFELGDLSDGEVAEVRTRVLRDQLGPKLAKEAQANFGAPILERPVGEPTRDEDGKRRAKAPERRERGEARGEGRRRVPAGDRGPSAQKNRREPPRSSRPERKRKHISALRAEIAAEAGGPRKRIERRATQDRRGRPVAVERLSAVRRETHERAEIDRGARRSRRPKQGAAQRDFETASTQERRSRGRKGPRDAVSEGRKRPPETRGDESLKRRSSEPRGEAGRRSPRSGEPRAHTKPSPQGGLREGAGKRPPRKGPSKGKGPRRPPRKR